MITRIISALVLIPVVLYGLFFLEFHNLVMAVGIISLIGAWEWSQFIEIENRIRSFIFPAFFIVLLSFFLVSDKDGLIELAFANPAILFIPSLGWLCIYLIVHQYPALPYNWSSSKTFKQLLGLQTLLPFIYAFAVLNALDLSGDYINAKLTLFVCLIVWTTDSGAYFCGKAFGRRKMSPSVSPNKTLEGLMGGVLSALLVGWFMSDVFGLPFAQTWQLNLIIVVTVMISVLGDLFMSLMKRVSNIKDSGKIIPGHGGILDRIDSLTAAFPVFSCFYLLLLN